MRVSEMESNMEFGISVSVRKKDGTLRFCVDFLKKLIIKSFDTPRGKLKYGPDNRFAQETLPISCTFIRYRVIK